MTQNSTPSGFIAAAAFRRPVRRVDRTASRSDDRKRSAKTLPLILFVVTVALFASLAAGCTIEKPARSATLMLMFSSRADLSRSLLPETPLSVSYYTVNGTGPDSNSFSISSQQSIASIPGLAVGEWTLTAIGWNSQDIPLISGASSIDLSPGNNQAELSLDSYYGSGTFSLLATWDQEKVYNPDFKLFIRPESGTEYEVYPTVAAGSAALQVALDSGSYLVRGLLYSEGELKAGFIEAVRIADSLETGGTVIIDLDTLVTDLAIAIADNAAVPVEGSITGLPAEPREGTLFNLTFTPTNVAEVDLDDLTAAWYLNGSPVGTGLSCGITPVAGRQRIDAVVRTSVPGSTGTASLTFSAEPSEAPVQKSLTTASVLEDDVDGLRLDGAQGILILPDGLILVASRIDDVIQTFRIVNGTPVLKQMFTYSSGLSLNGVQELQSNADGSLIFSISDYSKALMIFHHVPGSDLIEPIATFETYFTFGGVPCEIGILNSLGVDQAGQNIYIVDRFDNKIFHFYYDDTEVIPIACYTYLTDPAIELPKGLAVSPDGSRLAIPAANANALFIFTIDEATGIPTVESILSFSKTGTQGLTSVNSALFLDGDTILTTSDNFLCEFRYGPPQSGEAAAWHQTQRISEGGSVTNMKGPKAVVVNTEQDTVYVCTSVSDGITIFDRDPSTGILTYVDFVSIAPGDPAKGAITPDGSYLLLTSVVTDQLFTMTIVR